MAYNLIITERADEQIENLAEYLVNRIKNPDAALHFMNEPDAVYSRLEENPFQFPESQDPYLAHRGYHEALFQKMSYRVIFRVESDIVYIVGVYHNLQDYRKKMEE